jgi:hypothetical protein
MSNTEFPEPPEDFLKYPVGTVIALMTDGDSVAAALDDLRRCRLSTRQDLCVGWSGRC